MDDYRVDDYALELLNMNHIDTVKLAIEDKDNQLIL